MLDAYTKKEQSHCPTECTNVRNAGRDPFFAKSCRLGAARFSSAYASAVCPWQTSP